MYNQVNSIIELRSNSWEFILNKTATANYLIIFSTLLFATFLPSFNKFFYALALEISQRIRPTQPSIPRHYWAIHRRTKRSKTVEREGILAASSLQRRLCFPFKFLNRNFGHINDVMAGIAMLQKNVVSPFRSFSLNCFVEQVQWLIVELRIVCLVAPKQFIMNYIFPVWPCTKHGLSRMKVLFYS